MSMLSKNIFNDVVPGVRVAIDAFRRHVSIQSRNSAEHWPASQTLIQNIANELNLAIGDPSPPLMLKPVAQMLCVRVVLRPSRPSGQVGELRPVRGGFEASVFGEVDAALARREELRLWGEMARCLRGKESALSIDGRLTLAHELGHVFFYSADAPAAVPARLFARARVASKEYRREEGLCTDFARALLIDERSARAIPAQPSIATLMQIAKMFRVTPETAVRRLLHDWGAWPTVHIVRVVVKDRAKEITVFHGKKRRHHHKNYPTSTTLERRLAPANEMSEVADILRQSCVAGDSGTLTFADRIWGLIL